MLTDPVLLSSIKSLWDKLWSGGLNNPLDAIEQLSFLLFLKRLDEQEEDAQRQSRLRKQDYTPFFPDEKLRWSYWSKLEARQALDIVREKVFPFIKKLGEPIEIHGDKATTAEKSLTIHARADWKDSTLVREEAPRGEPPPPRDPFALLMANAEFKINKPSLLIEACKAIDAMQISSQNQDVQGDIYEYLLGQLNTAGTNGQFRTPRHIVRLMVRMMDPQPHERVCDPAAGTCGFLVNAWQHVLEQHTNPKHLSYDEDGFPHGLIGDRLSKEQWQFLQSKGFTGYDADSGMVMHRIGCMNLMLHGIKRPQFTYADTLSKGFTEASRYDVILANPPFKGAIDGSDVNPTLPVKCKKTEILFLHLFLRLLEQGGRAAVIVPDGVLFGSSNAHVEARRKLIEDNRLDGVVSMPSGVFKPYAGVSTAILFFTKGAKTEDIWFYDMEHDGFSLDDKRQRVPENDLPDVLSCWQQRHDEAFAKARAARLSKLKKQIAPLKQDRLKHHAIIHRLKFEEVIAVGKNADKARTSREEAEAELAELQVRIQPLENEINQLTRQFWVNKKQVAAQNYDLSASRYREVEHEETFYEDASITLERMLALEKVTVDIAKTLEGMQLA
jgi:type I restriction enzyme M protein